jgi:hypothetical protein
VPSTFNNPTKETMTMTKFFQATDGKITVFRATASGRAYQSALKLRNGISFSATPANLMEGAMPAVEITKGEYDALVALKAERLKASGTKGYTKPSDSWVFNASLPAAKPAKVLTGARGRVQAAKVAAYEAAKVANGKPAKAAKPAPAAKAAKVNGKPVPREGSFQAAMIKVLVRKQGATRPEMMAAAGSKTMPNAHFLNLMADRFGYECYADKADRSDVLVYQFVLPGAKPTAYGEEG